MEILRCPVCHNTLIRESNTFKCSLNHSYDIASKGYVNLLLANQHHTEISGDSKEMIEARVGFLNTNKYHILRKTILETINKYYQGETLSFLDIACGEGYYTNYLHSELTKIYETYTYGVDISKAGIIECAKKKKEQQLTNIDYVVGNLSNLPFIDNSFDVMLNCFAPMDEKEFNRVLKDNGIYIRVLPDVDHLLGIKKVLYKEVKLNVMKEQTINGFKLIDEIHIKDNITLDNNKMINDLFMMTPYYYKSPKETSIKLQAMDKLETIISFVLLVYKKD